MVEMEMIEEIKSAPRPSGESAPYFSAMIAKFGSRSMENVAPIASRFMPMSNAIGSPRTIVPIMCPTSWKARDNPASKISGNDGPNIVPSFDTNNIKEIPRIVAALFICFSFKIFSFGKLTIPPITSTYNIGKSAIVPTPTLNCTAPIHSAMTTKIRTSRCSFTLLVINIFSLFFFHFVITHLF